MTRAHITLAAYVIALAAAVTFGVRTVDAAHQAHRAWRIGGVTALGQRECPNLDGCTGRIDPFNGLPEALTSTGQRFHDNELVAISDPALGLRAGTRVQLLKWARGRMWRATVRIVGVTGCSAWFCSFELSPRAALATGQTAAAWDSPRWISWRVVR